MLDGPINRRSFLVYVQTILVPSREPGDIVVMDKPGFEPPRNMTLILLPSRSPELNPVENVWQYLRANWISNRVFETLEDIIDAACGAWRNLTDQPEVITSIGRRQWAHTGHS